MASASAVFGLAAFVVPPFAALAWLFAVAAVGYAAAGLFRP